tara:strand:+ start:18440 stop:18928 length:489 start_codon:yes stop_codon:yes gene_type:complete
MLKKIIILLSLSSIISIQANSISIEAKSILESSEYFKNTVIQYEKENNKKAFFPLGNGDSIEDFRNTLRIMNLKNFESPIKNPYYDRDGVFGLIKDKENLYLTIQSDIKTLNNNICRDLNNNNITKNLDNFTLTESLNYFDGNYSCFNNKDNKQNLYVYKIY